MVSTFECSHHVPAYVTEVRRCFKEAYAEAHLQMHCEAKKQKWYYDRTMSTMQLVPGVLGVKALLLIFTIGCLLLIT